MADILYPVIGSNISKRLVDMGDGTHAEVSSQYVSRVTWVDKSSTITSGGTPQTLVAANTSRRTFILKNNSSGDLEIYPSGFTGHLIIPAGAYFELPFPDTGVWMIKGATTAQSFTCWEAQ